MLESLQKISNHEISLKEPWLFYLYKTREHNYNVLRVNRLTDIHNHSVLNYVQNTLIILQDIHKKRTISSDVLLYVEETLKWSDVAKTGSKKTRKEWQQKGYDLFVHNIGSSQIYKEFNNDSIIEVLIATHGLIGQYLKGEVLLNKNKPLYDLIAYKKITKQQLQEILRLLNECIIKAVSPDLYLALKEDIEKVIVKIINNDLEEKEDMLDDCILRMQKLNHNFSITKKEEIGLFLRNETILSSLYHLFHQVELWYYDGILCEFNIEEQIKLLLMLYNHLEIEEHLSFEQFMYNLYFDYNNKKAINIYKKRIIETFLKEVSISSILENNVKQNPHVYMEVKKENKTIIFNFVFSLQAQKLIEFCEVAYISDTLYQKAVFLLYDLFGFRRDTYDRFYNEIDYLNTMNASLNQKAIILEYLTGKTILDVGPGGGALMDLICEKNKNYEVKGIDLSENVVEQLQKRKQEENRMWDIVKGDALHLTKYFAKESIDTIIYSSIIHELYSYIEYNGQKFNFETIAQTLQQAFQILAIGGRIIIRDGIMTEPKDEKRIIEFKNAEDIKILERYCQDFEGRVVAYEKLSTNKVKMLVNDAMEFLYTYTWGEKSYALEVHEQFGYFTPTEYIDFIKQNLPNCKIIVSQAFLQTGYEENLLPKITIYDEEQHIVKLPNSTCIIVIEKER